MKNLFVLITSLLCAVAMSAADIPQGYYDAIDGKKDSVLKSTLYQIVRGGERYAYGINQYHTSDSVGHWQAGDLKALGTWYAFPLTDMHPDGVVWDMYSNCVRYYPNKHGESGCSLNIEHCLPKSWWGVTSTTPKADTTTIYRDLYNLNPSDQRANSLKSNYAPGHVTAGDKFDNGSFRIDSKTKSQYGYICWEPAEEYRGDFARTYFYMVTAYENQQWSSTYSAYVNNNSYLRFTPTLIQVLLDWHRADPVSDKERCRTDQISDIQGNRNPFIDYPDLIEYIWGNKQGQTVNLANLKCEFQSGVCPDPILPTPEPQQYDTLINLPGLTAALINAVQGPITGSASSSTIRSNGSCSITMGNGSTDGEFSFTGLNLQDTAVLVFRASPYNSATSMQLDIYADDADTPLKSIQVTVEKDTRNEVRYRVTVPKGTNKLSILSVGGGTSKRACMQELYLLSPKKDPTAITTPESEAATTYKELRNGQVIIRRDASICNTLGQTIQ